MATATLINVSDLPKSDLRLMLAQIAELNPSMILCGLNGSRVAASLPGGDRVILPYRTGDHRGVLNAKSALKRAGFVTAAGKPVRAAKPARVVSATPVVVAEPIVADHVLPSVSARMKPRMTAHLNVSVLAGLSQAAEFVLGFQYNQDGVLVAARPLPLVGDNGDLVADAVACWSQLELSRLAYGRIERDGVRLWSDDLKRAYADALVTMIDVLKLVMVELVAAGVWFETVAL